MATFVLVHGAFGTPAELEPVVPHLEALGHRAVAVDLPCEDPRATFADYVRVTAASIDELKGPVIVAGHSAGGATIALLPTERIERLVFVTAVVPEPGRSILDTVGAKVVETLGEVTSDDGNGCRSFKLDVLAAMAPPGEQDAMLEYLRATQRPQGWAVMEEPWPGVGLPSVPCSYVLTTEDTLLVPSKQKEMAARLGVVPVEIASDHEVFGTRPAELAAILDELAR